MPPPTATTPRVHGRLASYGCGSLGELDAHVTALREKIRRQPEVWRDASAEMHDVDLLLDRRSTLASSG